MMKKYKVAKDDPLSHAGLRAVSYHSSYAVAVRKAKKLGKEYSVFVYKHPMGWGFVTKPAR